MTSMTTDFNKLYTLLDISSKGLDRYQALITCRGNGHTNVFLILWSGADSILKKGILYYFSPRSFRV